MHPCVPISSAITSPYCDRGAENKVSLYAAVTRRPTTPIHGSHTYGRHSALLIDHVDQVVFKDGRVYAQNRFVSTDVWDPSAPEGERAAGAVRVWTPRPGGWLKNVFKLPANPVNTSVMFKGGKLFALCEGGKPVEMDPVTLDTLGESDLGGIQARAG